MYYSGYTECLIEKDFSVNSLLTIELAQKESQSSESTYAKGL